MKGLLAISAALALAASVQGASASIVLQDDFDSSTGNTLNWAGDATFRSIPQPGNVSGSPSVDLVAASNGWGITTYSGNSVDLDGSTGTGFQPAGELDSVSSFGLQSYTLTFALSGNQRGASPQTTDVYMGNTLLHSYTLASGDPWLTYTLNFTGSGQLRFVENSVSDQQGNMLDSVVLSAVPEPSTWAMLIVGFFGLGFIGWRRDRASMKCPVTSEMTASA